MSKFIMIVAHPDDESLWGGDILVHASTTHSALVVCMTNGSNRIRCRRFKRAVALFGAEALILDFADRGDEPWTHAEEEEMRAVIRPIINDSTVDQVVTHSPSGEYGHFAHRSVSRIVTDEISEQSRLYYFSFDEQSDGELSSKKQKAFAIYFEGFSRTEYSTCFLPRNWLVSVTRQIEQALSALLGQILRRAAPRRLHKHFARRVANRNQRCPIRPHCSDIQHIRLSRYEKPCRADEYVFNAKLLAPLYPKLAPARNATSLYLRNREVYDAYPDRKYIVTEFLPRCVGKTLSVGCHSFNSDECFCLPNPPDFETIELDERYSDFGSPFKHTTGDFLDYSPPYCFKNIVLFGVMGINPESEKTSDSYSLYGLTERVTEHVDQLLEFGGRVLFGPDLTDDVWPNTSQAFRYWEHSLKMLLQDRGYELLESFATRTNGVFVLRKGTAAQRHGPVGMNRL